MKHPSNGRFEWLLLAAVSIVGIWAPSSSAETLADAIKSAYETNPSLLEKRAMQRALDETYVQARSGWRPSLGIQTEVAINREDLGQGEGTELVTDATGNLTPLSGGGNISYNSGNLKLQASLPLYTGGRVRAAVDASEADLLSGREGLRAAEIQLVLDVIQAYVDVQQSLKLIDVRRDNLSVLNQEVEQTLLNVKVGQATQVDLAQARAQQAAGRAQLAAAKSQLQVSSANYVSLVGSPPGVLSDETVLPTVPPTTEAAFEIAERDSPALLQALYAEQAARHRVAQARAATRPTITANASIGYVGTVVPLAKDRYNRELTASITITQPIYSGGNVSSQIRQALDRDEAARLAVESARRAVVQNLSQVWSNLSSSIEEVSADAEQVEATRLAFDGLREQNRLGLASTTDLLLQQQQFRDAQLTLIQARHNLLIAQATILAVIGRLDVQQLSPSVQRYDPADAFKKVNRSSHNPLEILPELSDQIASPRP